MPASFARPELLATIEWLAENLERPGVSVVDCRWRPDGTARAGFATGHIGGARHIDWSTDLVDPNDPVPYQLAGPEAVAAAAGRAGIGDGRDAILYDDGVALYAARVWWCLRAYGFDSARILDGGYRAWRDAGLPVASGPHYSARAVFTPRADLRLRVGAGDVRRILSDPQVFVVDARAPAEYLGQEGGASRLGHIPGAVNVPATLLTVPGSGLFRPAGELARLFGDAGLRGAHQRVIVYDGVGVGASKAAFVLALLGHADVAVYDGGWAEWGDRVELPVER